MEKYIIDERTGLKYKLVGDYYFIAGGNEPEERCTSEYGVSATNAISSRTREQSTQVCSSAVSCRIILPKSTSRQRKCFLSR